VVRAIAAQSEKLLFYSTAAPHENRERLAEALASRCPAPLSRVFFCNSGAEANEAALKYARKATGRTRVVALEGGFHGRTLGALSATGQPGKWEGFGPLVPGMAFARPNDVESLEAALAPAGDTALLLLEPVLGEGGVIPLEPAFAQAAQELAREVGALLCIDEVQAGCGRTGTFFAFEQLGIEPDLVTLAKGLANGLPIGALLAAEHAAAGFVPGDHGSTFGGNPVAAAAACAVVAALDDELLTGVRERGRQLADGLGGLPGVLEVRGRGLLLGATLDRPVAPVVDSCRERGLIALSAGPDVLRLTPPLVVGVAEVDEALAVLAGVLSA
jgi:acetylornithine aminotransferase